MALLSMTDAVSGGVASSTEYNKLIDNILDINARLNQPDGGSAGARLTALEALTTNTTTNGGYGNSRLADRLGTGVGTGSNVLTGSASSQLGDIRTRLSAVEASGGASGPYARYDLTSQVIPATTYTFLTFDVTTEASSAVTRSGSNFTLGLAGRWLVTVGLTTSGTISAGQYNVLLGANLTGSSGTSYGSYSSGYSAGGSSAFPMPVLSKVVLSDGTGIANVRLRTPGGSTTLSGSASNYIEFTYLGPVG
jgi:hypothetical protein